MLTSNYFGALHMETNIERTEPVFREPDTVAEQPHPFTFTGNGGEYFGIWIVNVILSIVTLGIYSAWAKVRRLQYFHRHTQVAGSSFDFHGRPIDILKGRAIAFGAYAAYIGLTKVSAVAALILALLLFIVIPFFVYKSLRFRLHNTSWRQVRFKFLGKVPGAYGAFFGWPIAMMVSMYTLAPLAHHQMNTYTLGNSALGTTVANFKASVGDFYKVYLKTFGLFLLYIFAVGALAALVIGTSSLDMKSMMKGMVDAAATADAKSTDTTNAGESDEDEEEATPAASTRSSDEQAKNMGAAAVLLTAMLPLVILGFYFLAFLLIGPYFNARINNVIWNGTKLGSMRFESKLSARKLSWITITNFLGIVFSFGFFKPFAAVRLTKYRVDCLKLIAAGPIATHVQAIAGNVNARGEEIAEMFDVDIGL
jgi:uncharacterized membrane protein YjgN (DUF898 family)